MSESITAGSDPITLATTSISSLLASVDAAPTPWAAIAFKTAIKRHGRDLIEAGGVEAMRVTLDRVGKSNAHRAVVLDAWDGVTGWQLGAVA